ncbi:MAG TPA: type II toxin-antitoxin system RelE/ParE family toxin, partial [Terriglobia bacterium]|nr:type II toxin-antitoxin system RelE/ParE family toxin [Terriglobia bacterium]
QAEESATFMKIVWTEQAIADLEEIEHYIAQERPSAARRVAAHLVTSVEHLAEFPQLGRPGPRPGMRSLVTPPYVISYRVRSGSLQVLTIWHGRRQRREIS